MRFGTIAHPPDKKRRVEKRERKRRQSLDGDGSWRRTTGERRVQQRRNGDSDDSHIIHLPFLDDEWDSETDENSQSATANPVNGAVPNNGIQSETSNSDAAMDDGKPVDDNKSPKDLNEQEQARLRSLKSMLDASNARYQQATKNRRPVFAAGLKVKVIKGEHIGKTGIVLDADYIESRALISLPDQESPRWLGFRSLGHAD